MKNERYYSKIDQICLSIDQAFKAVFGQPQTTGRQYPADKIEEPLLTKEQRKHSAALMRINHAGEVCAQALYHGQGLVSQRYEVHEKMQQAAIEEGDHLVWCQKRLTELGSHTSYLNPFWYIGSFSLGLAAGWIGDRWSLGFLAETEEQVIQHLASHLVQLPEQDEKSHRILQQMQQDEAHHRDDAIVFGAARLPNIIKVLMKLASKVMVKTVYWV